MYLDAQSLFSLLLLGGGGASRSIPEIVLLIAASLLFQSNWKWFRVIKDTFELKTSRFCTRVITHWRFKLSGD